MSTAAKKSKGPRPRVLMLVDESRPHLNEQAVELRPLVEQHVDVVAINGFNGSLPTVGIEFSIP